MRVVAIVQARMGSTRLPGKVLMPVLGRPLLAFMLERLARCHRIDAVVVATTTEPVDDAVVKAASECGVEVFRGSQDDVLDRYWQAAQEAKADVVVRLTADCPLVEPDVCDSVIALLGEPEPCDYAATSPLFAEGLDCEAMTMASLQRSWKEATLRSEREHVTLYIRNHQELFACKVLHNPVDESHFRVTVDEPADFEVISAVLAGLYPGNPVFSFAAVRSYLESHPEVAVKNSSIIRNQGLSKSLAHDGPAAPGGSL